MSIEFEEPVVNSYFAALLDKLDSNIATFVWKSPVIEDAKPITIPIPREQWEKQGRPGSIDFHFHPHVNIDKVFSEVKFSSSLLDIEPKDVVG